MERIKLSNREKSVLRRLRDGGFEALSELDYTAVKRLHGLGFVKAAFVEGGDPEDARLTAYGKEYFMSNPRLCNPVDWKWIITTTIALIAAVAAVIALFVSCGLINR